MTGLGVTWQAVIERACGRCQCAGACGRKHKESMDGRCLGRNDDSLPGALLRVVAADYSIPPDRAIGLPAGRLTAMCGACDDLAAARARRRVPPPAPMPGTVALFGVTP